MLPRRCNESLEVRSRRAQALCFTCVIYEERNRVTKVCEKGFHVSHLVDWTRKWEYFLTLIYHLGFSGNSR